MKVGLDLSLTISDLNSHELKWADSLHYTEIKVFNDPCELTKIASWIEDVLPGSVYS